MCVSFRRATSFLCPRRQSVLFAAHSACRCAHHFPLTLHTGVSWVCALSSQFCEDTETHLVTKQRAGGEWRGVGEGPLEIIKKKVKKWLWCGHVAVPATKEKGMLPMAAVETETQVPRKTLAWRKNFLKLILPPFFWGLLVFPLFSVWAFVSLYLLVEGCENGVLASCWESLHTEQTAHSYPKGYQPRLNCT